MKNVQTVDLPAGGIFDANDCCIRQYVILDIVVHPTTGIWIPEIADNHGRHHCCLIPEMFRPFEADLFRRKPRPLVTVEDCMRALNAHHEKVKNFYDDPMTEMCGCTEDFQSDFNSQERKIAHRLMELAPRGSDEWEMGVGYFDRYMP